MAAEGLRGWLSSLEVIPDTTGGITEGILDVGSYAGRQAGGTLTSEGGISIVAGGVAAVVVV